MKKTMIISAFPACGKTYLYENQDTLNFKYLGENLKFTFCYKLWFLSTYCLQRKKHISKKYFRFS